MKVAITATGDSLSSKLDNRFGRCSYFAIYDLDTNDTEFVQNPNKEVSEGAGPAVVQMIASLGVNQIISGEFGSKVRSILDNLNIQMVMFTDPEKSIQEIESLMIIK